ncbi:hypothetical protein HMPREF9141_1508 [Prevotella multiformis DSM 16608]|uniref:Uncharacterized protein n=1 Tax=Prevotella multiformis DSM 16608 TaxID=888743 RepID=F0F7E1_9BACT|nr:hypothetical protein HMPREF9141_1508 [Prevotella multiformis DSM 16608]
MKNEGLLKAPHSSERVQSYDYFRHTPNVLRLFYGSSVKCVDAFRIALTEEPKLITKQKHSQDRQLSILLSSSDTRAFSF